MYAQKDVNIKYLKIEGISKLFPLLASIAILIMCVALKCVPAWNLFSSIITYISMKIDPKGSMPPNITITRGSINHFFSGIGLGTAFTRHG